MCGELEGESAEFWSCMSQRRDDEQAEWRVVCVGNWRVRVPNSGVVRVREGRVSTGNDKLVCTSSSGLLWRERLLRYVDAITWCCSDLSPL